MKNIKNEYKGFLDDIEKNIKNKEDLERALKEALVVLKPEEKARFDRIRLEARKTIEEFSPEIINAKLLGFYENLLGHSRRL